MSQDKLVQESESLETRDDGDNVDGVDLVMASKHSTSNDDILDGVSASNVNVMSKTSSNELAT